MESEIDIVKEFIEIYGSEFTLGDLLNDLLEMQEAEEGY